VVRHLQIIGETAGRVSVDTHRILLDLTRYPCYYAIVIQSFKDDGTEDIFNGVNSRQARRACPVQLWGIASRKLDQLDSVVSLKELRIPPGNQFEALTGGRKGQYSIRINNQFRICFFWTDKGPGQVEIVDYH
jgi:proteic killer suppression protein